MSTCLSDAVMIFGQILSLERYRRSLLFPAHYFEVLLFFSLLLQLLSITLEATGHVRRETTQFHTPPSPYSLRRAPLFLGKKEGKEEIECVCGIP